MLVQGVTRDKSNNINESQIVERMSGEGIGERSCMCMLVRL